MTLAIVLIVLYLIFGGFTWVTLAGYDDVFDEIGATCGAVFWPAVLPVAIGVWLALAFRQWRTRPKRVADALKPH